MFSFKRSMKTNIIINWVHIGLFTFSSRFQRKSYCEKELICEENRLRVEYQIEKSLFSPKFIRLQFHMASWRNVLKMFFLDLFKEQRSLKHVGDR